MSLPIPQTYMAFPMVHCELRAKLVEFRAGRFREAACIWQHPAEHAAIALRIMVDRLLAKSGCFVVGWWFDPQLDVVRVKVIHGSFHPVQEGCMPEIEHVSMDYAELQRLLNTEDLA